MEIVTNRSRERPTLKTTSTASGIVIRHQKNHHTAQKSKMRGESDGIERRKIGGG